MEEWDLTPDDRKRYCVGYVFSPDLSDVVLIRKNRPEWQMGLLNGVGGKLHDGEDSLHGMARECREETGLDIAVWRRLARLEFPLAVVWFFWTIDPNCRLARTMTDERVEIVDVAKLASTMDGIVPNSAWLIQMAISYVRGERAEWFAVREVY